MKYCSQSWFTVFNFNFVPNTIFFSYRHRSEWEKCTTSKPSRPFLSVPNAIIFQSANRWCQGVNLGAQEEGVQLLLHHMLQSRQWRSLNCACGKLSFSAWFPGLWPLTLSWAFTFNDPSFMRLDLQIAKNSEHFNLKVRVASIWSITFVPCDNFKHFSSFW